MPRYGCALPGLLLLAACHATGQVRSGPPPSIVAALTPMMVENGVRVACLGDTSGVPLGTLPIDLLLAPDSAASSSVVRVVFTRTPTRDQQVVLSVALVEIGQTRRVGESCGSRGATLRATAARFSAIELSFTTWVPIRITVRDPEWRALATQTFTESTVRPFELPWRESGRSLTGVAADGEVMVRAQAFAGAHVQRAVLFDSPQLNAIR